MGVVEQCAEVEWVGQRVVGTINLGCRTCSVCLTDGPEHCPNRTTLGIRGKDGAYRMEIEKQQDAVRAAERVVEDKKKAMIEATQQFKALEKHKEKWTAEVKREMQIKEEDNLEDIAQTIFIKRQRDEREG